MSLELHEWDIHIVCLGTDDARVTGVRSGVGAATYGASKLSRACEFRRPLRLAGA